MQPRVHFHNITKRGNNSTAVRDLQDRVRAGRLGSSSGVEIVQWGRNTTISVPITRQEARIAAAVPHEPPRYA